MHLGLGTRFNRFFRNLGSIWGPKIPKNAPVGGPRDAREGSGMPLGKGFEKTLKNTVLLTLF